MDIRIIFFPFVGVKKVPDISEKLRIKLNIVSFLCFYFQSKPIFLHKVLFPNIHNIFIRLIYYIETQKTDIKSYIYANIENTCK